MGSMQNYTVQKKIGTGSYGSAYLVTKNEGKGRDDKKLVLKRINIKGNWIEKRAMIDQAMGSGVLIEYDAV